jgi:hypothetical protein
MIVRVVIGFPDAGDPENEVLLWLRSDRHDPHAGVRYGRRSRGAALTSRRDGFRSWPVVIEPGHDALVHAEREIPAALDLAQESGVVHRFLADRGFWRARKHAKFVGALDQRGSNLFDGGVIGLDHAPI